MARHSFFQSGAFKILVYLAGIVLLSALLSPWLYTGGKKVVAEGWLEGGLFDDLNGSMDRAKFSRYFNRAVLLSALVLLWPVLKWMNQGDRPKQTVREFLLLRPNPSWKRHLLVGFGVAAVSLLLLGGVYVLQGWYLGEVTDKPIYEILLEALGTGLAVGFLEEFVFRGALWAVLSKVLRPRTLFFTIAVFFAVIHFFNAPRKLDVGEVHFVTGFWFVGRIFEHFFSQFADPYFLLSEFAVLFAIGIVLGYTRVKTGSLWLGIGLHAGWVFGVKTLSPLTERNFERAEMMPWLGDNLRVGLVSTLLVAVTGAAIWWWLNRGKNEPSEEAS